MKNFRYPKKLRMASETGLLENGFELSKPTGSKLSAGNAECSKGGKPQTNAHASGKRSKASKQISNELCGYE